MKIIENPQGSMKFHKNSMNSMPQPANMQASKDPNPRIPASQMGASCVSPGCLLGASWVLPGCLLRASWVPPGCLLGASWVPPGCLLRASWSLLGVSWVPPGCFLGASCVLPGCLLGVYQPSGQPARRVGDRCDSLPIIYKKR